MAAPSLRCCDGLSLVVVSGATLQLLLVVASPVAEHGLWSVWAQ